MVQWWSEAEVAELTKLTAQGLSAGQISRRMGKTRNAIIGKWGRLGDKVANRAPRANGRPLIWSPERVAQLQKMWIGGYPSRAIAEELEVSLSAVDGKIRQIRPKHRTAQLPGYGRARPPRKKHKPFTGKTVSFRDHLDNQCRYVVGDPNGIETLYCADERLDGLSYCPEHFGLCTTRVVQRSNRPFLLCASNPPHSCSGGRTVVSDYCRVSG